MFKLGADPEVFLRAQNGSQFTSAHGLFPGTKESPHPIKGGGHVQVDGVAAEMNIPPAATQTEFVTNVHECMVGLKELVPQYRFMENSTVSLYNQKNLPPESLQLSCSADTDAYTGVTNLPHNEKSMCRSAGGHVHLGGIWEGAGFNNVLPQQRYEDSLRLGRLMDKHLGVYSILWDKDKVRRRTYGKAGTIRVKPYGIEYRTLSNKWLFHDEIMKFVFDQSKKAYTEWKLGADGDEMYKHIINGQDHKHPFFIINSIPMRRVRAMLGGSYA